MRSKLNIGVSWSVILILNNDNSHLVFTKDLRVIVGILESTQSVWVLGKVDECKASGLSTFRRTTATPRQVPHDATLQKEIQVVPITCKARHISIGQPRHVADLPSLAPKNGSYQIIGLRRWMDWLAKLYPRWNLKPRPHNHPWSEVECRSH